MKILKRIAAGILSATIAAGSLTVGVGAASSKMKLRTVSIDKIEGANDFWSIGDGYYALNNSADLNIDPDYDQFIYIGKDELKSWRKTGKISYKKVKTDVDMTDLLRNGSFTADGNYMQFVTCDKDRNALKRYVVSHNEKNTQITTAYTKGSDWSYTNPDGYTVENKWNEAKKTLTVTVTTPEGKKKSKKLTYKGEGIWLYSTCASAGTGKYVAYVAWKEDEYTVTDEYGESRPYKIFKIYGVKKNGKFDTLLTEDNIISFVGFDAGENWVSLSVSRGRAWSTVYFTDTGKTSTLVGGTISDNGGGISGKVYGTRAVLYSGSGDYRLYRLVDLSDGINKLSDAYQYMSTEDGKIYLVKNDKGQWGYIDKKGKELAMFDDAGAFIGDYAPVVKNGKAYLVDRNMKRVSERIDADGVFTYGEGLFRVTKDDKVMLMTYKK